MAQLMCPGCKSDMPEGMQYCQSCFLTPIPKPAAHQADESAPDSELSSTPVAAPPACGDPDCAHAGRPPATGCRHCGQRGPAPATTLLFEWGPVTVRAGRSLIVGRENSPISGRLADYTNVGRRHAEVRSDGCKLTVVDLDSMNGTFVNDERLPPSRATSVRAGDRIRFATRLQATVTGETA
jgi:hypothetical protein